MPRLCRARRRNFSRICLFSKGILASYTFAHRFLSAFEIFALPAAEITRFLAVVRSRLAVLLLLVVNFLLGRMLRGRPQANDSDLSEKATPVISYSDLAPPYLKTIYRGLCFGPNRPKGGPGG